MSATYEPWDLELDRDAEKRFIEIHGYVNEIAVGTVLEYDGWQWALVTEIAEDRDEPMFGFVLLDGVDDAIIKRLEPATGCQQHYAAVEHLRDSEHEYWAPVDYILSDDVWSVLGPVHPDHRAETAPSRTKNQTEDN